MTRDEFRRVLDSEYIERGGRRYAWTIPIVFPAYKSKVNNLEIGDTVAVKNEHGIIIGILEISDIYPFDKHGYNKAVYGTERIDHHR